jgi:molybdopterin-guanine dinucleotide biosynthesis protein A
MIDTQGFVLAGGKSSRMGRDKARLQRDGKPLVLRAAELMKPFVREVTLLGPPETFGDLGLPVIADQWPDLGPLAAICNGLLHSSAEWNIFLACDLPLLSGHFLKLLVDRASVSQADVVAPHTADGWQPLCAAYHSRCVKACVAALQDGRRSLIKLFDDVRVEAITSGDLAAAGLGESTFTNVNTPDDWARIVERS